MPAITYLTMMGSKSARWVDSYYWIMALNPGSQPETRSFAGMMLPSCDFLHRPYRSSGLDIAV